MSPHRSEIWHDPALPYVESRRACQSRACYRAHSHPSLSIGAVDAGFSRFTGAGEGEVRLTPGTLVLVPAERVHACNPEPGQAWSYQMLHLDAQWLRSLRLESGVAAGEPGAAARIVRSRTVYRQFCALNALLFSAAPPLAKEAALVAFIGEQDFAAHPALLPAPALQPSLLGELLGRLEAQALDGVNLGQLAEQAGMGRYQLIRAFAAATGLTPHAYLLNARVNQARTLLRQGQALAEVAYRLGFADQAHFQRVFKAHAGVTPGVYRASAIPPGAVMTGSGP